MIAAWNNVCGDVHTYKLHNGSSAAELVSQARLADERLRSLIDAGDQEGYSAQRAREAHAHALALNAVELQQLRDSVKENAAPFVNAGDAVADGECL